MLLGDVKVTVHIRRDILKPGNAPVEDLGFGLDCGQQRRNSPVKTSTFELFLSNGRIRNGYKL